MVAATKLKSSDDQQAQNELDHLARYGLIRRIKNEGNVAVDDGSRCLYLKDENVRAHRAQILKYANDPKGAKKCRQNAGHRDRQRLFPALLRIESIWTFYI
jgi:hypothetical protein